jgi:hypothetical protein
MPEAPPPKLEVPHPVLVPLPAGTLVWRAHAAKHQKSLFNPNPRDPQFLDGRFSGMAPDPFPYCYIGLDPATTLLEKYARTVPFLDQGPRVLKRSVLRGVVLSEYEVVRDLTLVGLRTTAELAAVCQDEWLVHAEGHDHAKTRRWGQWIRGHSPAHGLVWPSKRDIGRYSAVLFGDRCSDPLRPVGSPLPLLGTREDEVNTLLEPYRLVIAPAPVRTRLSPGDEPGTIRA